MFFRLGAIGLLLLTACEKAPGVPGSSCGSNDDCLAGSVCVADACRQLCVIDDHCMGGGWCDSNGTCTLGSLDDYDEPTTSNQPSHTEQSTPEPLTGFTVTPSNHTLDINDPPVQLLAAVMPTTAQCPYELLWSSSDETVVSVTTAGLVSPISAGSATITVQCGIGGSTPRGIASLMVVDPSVSTLTAFNISPPSATIKTDADPSSIQLSATNAPTTADDCPQALTWLSSDPSKALVSADGSVSAVSPGEVTITAQCGSGSTAPRGTATITIENGVPYVFPCQDYLAGQLGDSVRFQISVTDAGAGMGTVRFYIDGEQLGADAVENSCLQSAVTFVSEPVALANYASGTHEILVEFFDCSANLGTCSGSFAK